MRVTMMKNTTTVTTVTATSTNNFGRPTSPELLERHHTGEDVLAQPNEYYADENIKQEPTNQQILSADLLLYAFQNKSVALLRHLTEQRSLHDSILDASEVLLAALKNNSYLAFEQKLYQSIENYIKIWVEKKSQGKSPLTSAPEDEQYQVLLKEIKINFTVKNNLKNSQALALGRNLTPSDFMEQYSKKTKAPLLFSAYQAYSRDYWAQCILDEFRKQCAQLNFHFYDCDNTIDAEMQKMRIELGRRADALFDDVNSFEFTLITKQKDGKSFIQEPKKIQEQVKLLSEDANQRLIEARQSYQDEKEKYKKQKADKTNCATQIKKYISSLETSAEINLSEHEAMLLNNPHKFALNKPCVPSAENSGNLLTATQWLLVEHYNRWRKHRNNTFAPTEKENAFYTYLKVCGALHIFTEQSINALQSEEQKVDSAIYTRRLAVVMNSNALGSMNSARAIISMEPASLYESPIKWRWDIWNKLSLNTKLEQEEAYPFKILSPNFFSYKDMTEAILRTYDSKYIFSVLKHFNVQVTPDFANLRIPELYDWTLLHLVIFQDTIEAGEAFFSQKVLLNSKDCYGKSPAKLLAGRIKILRDKLIACDVRLLNLDKNLRMLRMKNQPQEHVSQVHKLVNAGLSVAHLLERENELKAQRESVKKSLRLYCEVALALRHNSQFILDIVQKNAFLNKIESTLEALATALKQTSPIRKNDECNKRLCSVMKCIEVLQMQVVIAYIRKEIFDLFIDMREFLASIQCINAFLPKAKKLIETLHALMQEAVTNSQALIGSEEFKSIVEICNEAMEKSAEREQENAAIKGENAAIKQETAAIKQEATAIKEKNVILTEENEELRRQAQLLQEQLNNFLAQSQTKAPDEQSQAEQTAKHGMFKQKPAGGKSSTDTPSDEEKNEPKEEFHQKHH